MKEQEQREKDPHLDIPSEANREKHINFLKAEEDNPERTRDHKTDNSNRREQWKEGLEEGQKANQSSDTDQNRSAPANGNQSPMPMDNDDTLGIP